MARLLARAPEIDVVTDPEPHQLYLPDATPEEREREERETAKQQIADAYQSLQSEHHGELMSCLIGPAAPVADPTSVEQLRYALRLAKACQDVYNDREVPSESAAGEGEVYVDLEGAGLDRVEDDGLRERGLSPDYFNCASGYQAALYVDKSSVAGAECSFTVRDLRGEFEQRYPDLAEAGAKLFPEELVVELPKPAAETPPSYILANRGSEELIEHWEAWETNADQAVGGLPLGSALPTPQYREAVILGKLVHRAVGGRVTFAGHSLGGGLASAQALATGAPAVTFNAAGLDDTTEKMVSRPGATYQEITSYFVNGELLSSFQDDPLFILKRFPLLGALNLIFDRAEGRRVALSSEPLGDRGMMELHKIHSVVDALESALAEPGRGLATEP